jgi:hypothetical protein
MLAAMTSTTAQAPMIAHTRSVIVWRRSSMIPSQQPSSAAVEDGISANQQREAAK